MKNTYTDVPCNIYTPIIKYNIEVTNNQQPKLSLIIDSIFTTFTIRINKLHQY